MTEPGDPSSTGATAAEPAPDEPAEPGRIDALKVRATDATESAQGAFDDLLLRSPVVRLLKATVDHFLGVNGSILAGYLAYRLFLLLLPLIVIIVALAGFSATSTTEASDHLRLGSAVANTIATAGEEAHKGRGPLLITGIVGFAIASWGLLGAMQFVYAQAWGIPTRKFPGKAKRFFKLAGSLLLFGLVFYVSALVRKAGVVAGLASSMTTVLSVGVAYLGMGWILPRRSKEWFWLLPGTATAIAGHVILQALATFYLPEKLAGASQTYGALGLTVTMFSYLFLLSLFLVLGPVVNATMWKYYQQDPPGVLRRIAEKLPIPMTSIGSGYVPEGSVVDTSVSLPASSGSANS